LKKSDYAVSYAYAYTALVTIILLVPLMVYSLHLKELYKIKNEQELVRNTALVLKAINEHNSADEYFKYPRFSSFRSGLYDVRGKRIFSLLTEEPSFFKNGYSVEKQRAYYVTTLPEDRYFDAKYLIVENRISYYEVYEQVLLILLSIVAVVFLLSVLFLDRFARPFAEVNKKLDNFIKDSMHEINTPLAIININVDLYNRKYGTNKHLQRIKASAKVLANIYNDMDYLIKHDLVELKPEEVDLCDFLSDRVEYFEEVATLKGISIIKSCECCAKIYMNAKQLQRVVDNSISNAIKYSFENQSIEVGSRLTPSGECQIYFKDQGIGIDDTEKIFDRYYRESKQVGGLGIGLNIVRTIIQRENIKVQIDSKPNNGASFYYTFPKNITTFN